MALSITQIPKYRYLTAGEDIIFTASDAPTVLLYKKVKFIAEVYVSDTPIVPITSPIGTFKTTPNAVGVGIFDFSPILESFVSPDNVANDGSKYKAAITADDSTPVHIIDEFSRNKNTVRYFAIVFKIEYLDETTGLIVEGDIEKNSESYTYFNGYLKHTDVLDITGNDFGYNLNRFFLKQVSVVGDVTAKFLTNAPMVQNALATDYGTISMFSFPNGTNNMLSFIRLTYTDSSGVETSEDVPNIATNGGFTIFSSKSTDQILFFGCYPANIYNWSLAFKFLVDANNLKSYTVQGFNADSSLVTTSLKINILCPNLKGFEPIRLTWLNQWGTWDYYTFNMKSSKSVSTKGSTYQQIEGTWNKYRYEINGYKGGKKSFRVNSTEKIKMNTDFVSEAESEWFEELINSPEVYILNGYQEDRPFSYLNNYVIPVRLTTSSYTRKTIANDKLMQYTFEVEKSKILRTQSV
tara:strand:+ start:700 stop:2097 length:1398 start_codon:yes stop_codon:yes gene_type:complete